MTTSVIGSPALSSDDGSPLITILNRNDVLLGRGSGPNLYFGNLQFRDLVAEKRDAYKASDSVDEKRDIAQSIVDQIHARGGRFLRRRNNKKKSPVTREAWCEVSNGVAVEKAKQALREKNPPQSQGAAFSESSIMAAMNTSQKRSAQNETMTSFRGSLATQAGYASNVVSPPVGGEPGPQVVLSSLLPSTLNGGSTQAPAPADSRLLLFQSTPFALRQPLVVSQPIQTTSLYLPHPTLNQGYPFGPLPDVIASQQGLSLQDLHQTTSAAVAASSTAQLYSQFQNSFHLQSPPRTPEPSSNASLLANKNGTGETSAAVMDHSTVSHDTTASVSLQTKEDDVAAFLLSSLAVSDRPVITPEQEALERETLSDEEKASILADAFGSYCSVDSGRQNKKARKDLDRASIAFLVRLMRAEIDSIPAKDKPALMEAQEKARPEEFSDARLEKFLRVEGMNAKSAAARFVRYWEGRREAFGPKKYLMRMRLSEALRDDLVALEAAMCYLLPSPDRSGRQLLFIDCKRHTREGYSSESMLRAIWYTFEVAAAENTDIGGGLVQISWVKNSTLWDYDLKVYDRWAYFQSQAWPVRIICSHVCCSPYIILKVVKPIIHRFSNKRTRTRTIMHDAPEKDILSVLAKYGIDASVLPTTMGGQMELRQSEWIADRYAAELESEQL